MALNNGKAEWMVKLDDCTWAGGWASTGSNDGLHVIAVTTQSHSGQIATDGSRVYCRRQYTYSAPFRHVLDYENAPGKWPEKHILRTQLGPNENGRHWPSRRQREHATQ
jgi:hypothetical protein